MSEKHQFFIGKLEIPPPKFEHERTADAYVTRITYYLPKIFPVPYPLTKGRSA